MFDHFKQKIKGINAINVTPFDTGLEIDWPSLRSNIAFLLERGSRRSIRAATPGSSMR
ncbi:hypothetical protein LJK88_05835 [Paenibacillus sp. P26]|nr:hypothetical protein LJK88_05835 [Paenibacillus sp. P26]